MIYKHLFMLLSGGLCINSEQAIFTTRVHVFQIDPDTKKKWLPVSSQPVPVSFYHDSARCSYRIISLDGSKVHCFYSTFILHNYRCNFYSLDCM